MQKTMYVLLSIFVIVAIMGVGIAARPRTIPPDQAAPFSVLGDKIEDLQSQINDLVSRMVAVEEKNTEQDTSIAALDTAALQDQIDDLQAENDALNAEIDDLRSSIPKIAHVAYHGAMFGTECPLPEGFTFDDCEVIITPWTEFVNTGKDSDTNIVKDYVVHKWVPGGDEVIVGGGFGTRTYNDGTTEDYEVDDWVNVDIICIK